MVNQIQLVKLQASPILKKNFKNVAFYKKNWRESKASATSATTATTTTTKTTTTTTTEHNDFSKGPNPRHQIQRTESKALEMFTN